MQPSIRSTTMKAIFLTAFIVWLAGCVTVPSPPTHLSMTYMTGRTATYRMVSESTRSVEWQGLTAQAMDDLQGGTSGRVLDLTVTVTEVQVDPNGHAILDIKIDRLAYKGFARDELSLDYDSRRTDNPSSAFAYLIGANYRIEVDAAGRALRVVTPFTGLQTVDAQIPHLQTARGLVSERAILDRHGIDALAGEKHLAKPGQSWSVTHNFAFGQMGSKTFNKTYTVKDVKTVNTVPMALIEMTAEPTSDSSNSPLGSMLTSKESYTGELEFDLATGQVAVWQETLEVTWTFVDPTTDHLDETKQRSGLMRARQSILIQRIDS